MSAATETRLTAHDIGLLGMFLPEVAGIALNRDERLPLERAGYIEWVGTTFGSPMYQITDAGRAALAKARGEAVS